MGFCLSHKHVRTPHGFTFRNVHSHTPGWRCRCGQRGTRWPQRPLHKSETGKFWFMTQRVSSQVSGRVRTSNARVCQLVHVRWPILCLRLKLVTRQIKPSGHARTYSRIRTASGRVWGGRSLQTSPLSQRSRGWRRHRRLRTHQGCPDPQKPGSVWACACTCCFVQLFVCAFCSHRASRGMRGT